MSEELDATEAAVHLRITPELLYHYVRYGAKGRGFRRLTCVPGSGARRFAKAALDDYDAWLREPWAEVGTPRQDPPKGVRDYLKVESGGICPCCRSAGPFEDAHIEQWSRSRSNHHHNLLRLCGTCHRRYDRSEIPRAEIEGLKQDAIARVQERIRHRPAPQWPIPSAPPVARSFYGRGTELTKTVEALRSQPSLCVVGVGGIGKTQLVLRALREAVTGRPIIWIGIDTLGGAVSLEDILLARARMHGVEIRDGRPLLDNVRACLVFDGIERVADRRDEASDLIERLLADYSDTLVVVTSQVMLSALDFAETLKLGPIDAAAAIAILDCHPASSSMDALLRFADGHPLTLRLLKVLLRHYGEARVVEGELTRLGAAAVADPQRRSQSTATSLTACLELAYAQLSTVERGLLWIVSSSLAGFRPGLHDLRMLAGPDAAVAVAELRSWNLVDEQPDPAFEPGAPPHAVLAMLSPVRAFVRARTADDDTVPWDDIALRFVRSQAMLSTFTQNGILRRGEARTGRALMKRELPNIVSAFECAVGRVERQPRLLSLIVSIAHSTMMTFFMSGEFLVGVEVMRKAAAVAARHGLPVDAIQFLYQMQTLAERHGDRETAEWARGEAERIGEGASGEGRAFLFLTRASEAERRGDFARAAMRAREAYDLFATLDDCAEEQFKSAGFSLGRALEFGGRPDEALPYFREALLWAERSDDPINRGSILHHIGNCEAYAERYQAAMHAYRQAGEQFVALNAVEYVSNAIGEAGLLVARLDPLIGLPSRKLVEAALSDIVERLAQDLWGGPDVASNPRVTLRKLAGVVALALHNGHEEHLGTIADDMYARLVEPFVGIEPTEPQRMLLYPIQWQIRLFQLIAYLSDPDPERCLLESETVLLGWMSARAFVTEMPLIADPIASYLRRRRGMSDMTSNDFHALMVTDGDPAKLRDLPRQAHADGTDLGWLS